MSGHALINMIYTYAGAIFPLLSHVSLQLNALSCATLHSSYFCRGYLCTHGHLSTQNNVPFYDVYRRIRMFIVFLSRYCNLHIHINKSKPNTCTVSECMGFWWWHEAVGITAAPRQQSNKQSSSEEACTCQIEEVIWYHN